MLPLTVEKWFGVFGCWRLSGSSGPCPLLPPCAANLVPGLQLQPACGARVTVTEGARARLPSHARLSSLPRMFDERIFTGMCGDCPVCSKATKLMPLSA